MTEQTNIDLIPWVHNSLSLYHHKVARYIKNKIPKNSYLALEITQKRLDFYNKVLRKIMRSPLGFDQDYFITKNNHDQAFAYIDILNECYKKNINIIPIESKMVLKSHYNYTYKYNAKKYFGVIHEDDEKIHEIKEEEFRKMREESMAKTISQTLIHNPKIKHLYVLTGANHTGFLQKKLQELEFPRKLNVNINTKMFSGKIIDLYVFLKTKLRTLKDFLIKEENKRNFKPDAYYKDKLQEYDTLRNKFAILDLRIKSKDNTFNSFYNDEIRTSLKKRKYFSDRRIKRKLEEHKKRKPIKRVYSHKPI